MFERPELKVGILVVVSCVIIGYMSMRVAKGVGGFTSKETHTMQVSDATGIVPNTAVKMAGVKVGVVDEIKLVDGKAVLTLSIQKGLGLTESSFAEFKSDGILGSKHIAISNGRPDDPPLQKNAQLNTLSSGDSMSDVLKEVGRVARSLNDVAQAFKEATVTGSTETPIGRIVTNIEMLTEDLADISSANKSKVNNILTKLDGIAGTLDSILGEQARGRVNQSMDNLHSGLEKFDETLANVRSITEKVNTGEGTIGRLINDEETVNGINQVVDNLNAILGGARRLRTSFDYHSEIMANEGDIRSFIGVRLQPGPDRYYELHAISDPFGVKKSKRVIKDGSQNEDYEEIITYDNKLKLSLLFAKNFYNFTIKGGLIENTGGFGLDYYAFNNDLRLSAEFFDFDDTNVRLLARYNIYSGIYVTGGYNSILGDDDTISSPFVGAGVFLDNNDLATLASFFLRW